MAIINRAPGNLRISPITRRKLDVTTKDSRYPTTITVHPTEGLNNLTAGFSILLPPLGIQVY
jgi:hypothetical protein